MSSDADHVGESFNPYSVVHVVFAHLTEQGLHPTLGESGDPEPPARALLEALGIEAALEGNRKVAHQVRGELAELRAAVFGEE